MCYCGL